MLEERNNDLRALEQMVNSLRDPGSFESSISQYQRQLDELESLRKEQQNSSLSIKQAVLQEFNDFMQAYAELRAYQEKALKEMKDYKDNRKCYVVDLSAEDQDLLSE